VDSASLRKFKEKFNDKVKLRIRFSLENLKLDDDLLNIPLFMADYADKCNLLLKIINEIKAVTDIDSTK
jgi:hypothetical protein